MTSKEKEVAMAVLITIACILLVFMWWVRSSIPTDEELDEYRRMQECIESASTPHGMSIVEYRTMMSICKED